MFDAQIILVRVRRFQMGVNNRCVCIEAREGPERIQEIYAMVQRLAKRIGGAGRSKRITQERVSSGGRGRHIRFVNTDIGGGVEWCLTIELEVVLGL